MSSFPTASPSAAPFAYADGALVKKLVIQCALSRVCGGCGEPLGRPVAFLGDDAETERNEFHNPPMHAACAEQVRALFNPLWVVTLTSGFEFIRPHRDDADRMPRFTPNSAL